MFRNACVFVLFCSASALQLEGAQLKLDTAKPKTVQNGRTAGRATACSALQNMGSHSTVQIQVGTPLRGTKPQLFDVVADTGSDSVIVPSCTCVADWQCNPDDKCFTGSNRSSTFKLFMKEDYAQLIKITFGSGPIEAVVASDMVKVGSVQANMTNSVLLMVDNELDISGPFEGILGLGVPKQKVRNNTRDFDMPDSFLDVSGTTRFSICFNFPDADGVSVDGALRLDAPLPHNSISLGSVGRLHWGLDFRGISIGDANATVAFCGHDEKTHEQETACGIIPDSGTTLMMGSETQIVKLFSDLCDKWDRCANYYANQSLRHNVSVKKHIAFQDLLMDCDSWMTNEDLSELPPLHFHVAGKEGNQQLISLSGNDYVLLSMAEEVKIVTEKLGGVFPVRRKVGTGSFRKVCAPAFGSMEYNTILNGPVWIMGTALFYKYQVFYNLKTSPPSMSFVEEPCGSCREPEVLLSTGAGISSGVTGKARKLSGRVRVPQIDTSKPL